MAALLQMAGTVSSSICNNVASMVPSPSAATTALASPRRSLVPFLSYFNSRAAATSSNLYELVRGIGEGKCTQAAVLNGDVETQSCRNNDMDAKTQVQPTRREKSKGADGSANGGGNFGEDDNGDDEEEKRDLRNQQKGRKPGEKAPDYYANVGDAIRTLRKELPCMFQEDLSYGIYREDIVLTFREWSLHGVQNYKQVMKSLRATSRIFFKDIWVEVQRIWQGVPRDDVILVRWSIRGIPRLPWNAEAQFDGVSEYKVDSNGLIYEHKIENVILWPSQSYQVAPWARNTVPIGIGTPLCIQGQGRSVNPALEEGHTGLLNMASCSSMQLCQVSPTGEPLVMNSATHLFGLEVRETTRLLEDLQQYSSTEPGGDGRAVRWAYVGAWVWPDQERNTDQTSLKTRSTSERARELVFWYASRLLSQSKLDMSAEIIRFQLTTISTVDR